MFGLRTIKKMNLEKALERNFDVNSEPAALCERLPGHIVDKLASLHDNTRNVQYLEELSDLIRTYAKDLYHK